MPLPVEIFIPFIFILGLVLGSFANVLIFRMPRKQSIAFPSSNCTSCKTPIKPYDNIPLASYIILRGRCRHCGAKISPRYPLVELSTALLFILLLKYFGLTSQFAFFAVFTFIMLVHAFIDYDYYLLLDKLNIAGLLLGVGILLISKDLDIIEGLLGAVVGGGLLGLVYLLMLVIFRKEGMGIGDIKTAAMCGLYLGVIGVIFMFIIASVVGIIWGIGRMMAGKGRMLPFGTMMAPASVIVIFFGDYLSELFFAF